MFQSMCSKPETKSLETVYCTFLDRLTVASYGTVSRFLACFILGQHDTSHNNVLKTWKNNVIIIFIGN